MYASSPTTFLLPAFVGEAPEVGLYVGGLVDKAHLRFYYDIYLAVDRQVVERHLYALTPLVRRLDLEIVEAEPCRAERYVVALARRQHTVAV